MAAPRNQLGFLRNLIYGLKQTYGAPADFYQESDETVDFTTGVRSVTTQKWKVRRAVCLPTVTSAESLFPVELKRIWKRDAAVEAGTKVILVDRKDLPAGLRVETHGWYVVIDRRRYEVLKVEEFELQAAYLVTLKEMAGVRVYEQVEVKVADDIDSTEEVDSASGS